MRSLNMFEHTVEASSWPEAQWAAVLIPCLVGSAQQAVDTLPAAEVSDYKKVQDTILQTLNLSLEVYMRWLQEMSGLGYRPHLTEQQVQVPCTVCDGYDQQYRQCNK